MSQIGEPYVTTMSEKECEAYEAFKDFHQQYLQVVESQQLSDIIKGIMDTANPPMPLKSLEEALTEASTEQLPG